MAKLCQFCECDHAETGPCPTFTEMFVEALPPATEQNGVCARHCELCDGADHHWDYDEDSDPDEPNMACRHCEATRPMTDQDACDHDDYEEDILIGRCTCTMCGFRWYLMPRPGWALRVHGRRLGRVQGDRNSASWRT